MQAELVCPTKLDIDGTILVSISGGADSDVIMDLVERFKGDADVKYVWFDTGLEYEATKRHLPYLEERYGVKIETFKAVVPIPISCKEHGVPFLSKDISRKMYSLQSHGFKWEDRPFDVLLAEYPKCKNALEWWCNKKQKQGWISKNTYLKEFIIENPPDILISAYCCTGAKKLPSAHANKEHNAILSITGERRAEGGIRATAIKSCFAPAKGSHIAKYRPLFFFADSDKKIYEREHNIVHSECYTKYGMKRTGCAGCPFGSKFEDVLITLEQYEPQLYKAANAIFGKSYEYTRRYREYKENRKSIDRQKRRAGLPKEQISFAELEMIN